MGLANLNPEISARKPPDYIRGFMTLGHLFVSPPHLRLFLPRALPLPGRMTLTCAPFGKEP